MLYSRDASGPSKPNLFINEQWPMYPIADFDSGMVSSNQGYFAALRVRARLAQGLRPPLVQQVPLPPP